MIFVSSHAPCLVPCSSNPRPYPQNNRRKLKSRRQQEEKTKAAVEAEAHALALKQEALQREMDEREERKEVEDAAVQPAPPCGAARVPPLAMNMAKLQACEAPPPSSGRSSSAAYESVSETPRGSVSETPRGRRTRREMKGKSGLEKVCPPQLPHILPSCCPL